jgi:hypothetical protein
MAWSTLRWLSWSSWALLFEPGPVAHWKLNNPNVGRMCGNSFLCSTNGGAPVCAGGVAWPDDALTHMTQTSEEEKNAPRITGGWKLRHVHHRPS